MQRHHRTLWFSALLIASCGGAPNWQLACGCMPASNRAAQELGITSFLEDGSIDAKLLVTKLDEYFSRPRDATETLVAVRELGPFHSQSCYQVNLHLVRCYYWLFSPANNLKSWESQPF